MRHIKRLIAFIVSATRLSIRGIDGEYVSPLLAIDVAWGTTGDRYRNWPRHEENLLLATGVRAPLNWREGFREWRARRRLMRKATKLSRELGDFQLMDKIELRRRRVNEWIQASEEHDEIYPFLVDARWLLAIAERALWIKQAQRNQRKVSVR